MSKEQKFLLGFIQLYAASPCLWDPKHKLYHCKVSRNKAWDALLKKYREFYPDTHIIQVKRKIEAYRSMYKMVHTKVLLSKKSGDPNKFYRPKLWYYEEMQFLNNILNFNLDQYEQKVAKQDQRAQTEVEITQPSSRKIDHDTSSESDNDEKQDESEEGEEQEEGGGDEDNSEEIETEQLDDDLWDKEVQVVYQPVVSTSATSSAQKNRNKPTILKVETLTSAEPKRRKDNPSEPIEQSEYESQYLEFLDAEFLSGSSSGQKVDSTSVPASTVSAGRDSEAESFGMTIGLQLKGLESGQKVIAQKLISDVIFLARLNKLKPSSSITSP